MSDPSIPEGAVIDQPAEVTNARPALPAPNLPFDALQSITRLLVGLALIGGDELLSRLQSVEKEITAQPPDPQALAERIRNSPTGQLIPDDVRHALIGLAFEVQEQIRVGTPRLLATADQIITGLTQPAQSILNRIPIVGSLSKSIGLQYDALQRRGEDRTKRWIAIGRREEARSRVVADAAYNRIVDDFIDYLADKPEIQELIAGQTTGLAAEVLDEVRERTVSGDSFLEGLVRAVLRKAPRAEVPPPPMEVRQSAVVIPERPLMAQGDSEKP